MSDTLKLMVPVKPEYVRTVRLAVSSLADNAGFDVEAVEDIKVAVSEACSNIVSHCKTSGYTPGEDDLYRVICKIESDRMEISIEDEGGGYDLSKYREPSCGEIKEGGLGIFIIKTLMDEVYILSELGVGTRIRMIKML